MDVLSYPADPFDIEIAEGIVFTVKPLSSTLDMAVAQAAAQLALDRLEESAGVCREAGLLPPGRILHFSKAEERQGFYFRQLIAELAVRHITAWTGVMAGEEDAEVTEDSIRAVVDKYPIGEIFYDRFTKKHVEFVTAKKESGTGVHGISSPTPVPYTAQDANQTDCPVPMENAD